MANLITLAQYQSLTNSATSANDTLIEQLITITSNQIESYCDRTFALTNIKEELHAECDGTFYPSNYPIVQLKWIGEPKEFIEASSTEIYSININQSNFIVNNTTTDLTSSYALSSFSTINDLVTAIEANFTTLELAVTVNSLPILLVPGVYILNDENVKINGVEIINTNCKISHNCIFTYIHGSYYFYYSAGYSTIPLDLQYTCALIVRDALGVTLNTINSNMKSESITNYSYTLQDNINWKNILHNYIYILGNYCKVVLV